MGVSRPKSATSLFLRKNNTEKDEYIKYFKLENVPDKMPSFAQ